MIVFPNCKINLGLNILRKRGDGFHDLETVFYPLPLYDVLEVMPGGKKEEYIKDVLFSSSGIAVAGGDDENLCIKAYHLLRSDFPSLPTLQMHLHKTIPIGAGLGGGSSDGAFCLKLLNEKFKLHLSTERLTEYALQLGSDCPFFIGNEPCFAMGRGEMMEPITLDLSTYQFILVNPGIHIHTAQAFYQLTLAVPPKSIKDIIRQPIQTWKTELLNDFEEVVFRQYPEIKNIKENLYATGASYASMSGSGSTVYGIFEKEKKVDIAFPKSYFIWKKL